MASTLLHSPPSNLDQTGKRLLFAHYKYFIQAGKMAQLCENTAAMEATLLLLFLKPHIR